MTFVVGCVYVKKLAKKCVLTIQKNRVCPRSKSRPVFELVLVPVEDVRRSPFGCLVLQD